MVKVAFGSSLAHKDPKKVCTEEALIPVYAVDVEDSERVYSKQSSLWCPCVCLGLGLMLSGVVVGGAYLYRSYMMKTGQVYFCGVGYREEDYMVETEDCDMPAPLLQQQQYLRESVRLLEEEQVEFIEVPRFAEGDAGTIVHDFKKMLSAYLNQELNRCYVMPLNASLVMPPKDLKELLINIQARTYLPQTYLVREQMVVTERLDSLENTGQFIHRTCQGRPTYRLEHRAVVPGVQKREALDCHKMRHFENTFVVETQICQL